MSDQADIELRVLSDPRNLCVARAAVEAAVTRLGFGEDQVAQIILAVDEAMANAMRHGYDGATDQPIWLRFHVLPGDMPSFQIVIEDQGRQIDPEQIRGRDLDDLRPGGLGVHIIRQVMDQVSYSCRDGGGMKLVMSKTARPAPPPPQSPGGSLDVSKEVPSQ